MPNVCQESPVMPAMPIATGANSKPITATIAPIAAGGNNTSIQPMPTKRTIKDNTTKATPKAIKPPCAASYGIPAAITDNTGAIKAKLEPKYEGILPLQMNKYKMVPIPFINKAVAGSAFNKYGTNTVEPNMANKCWKLSGNMAALLGRSDTSIKSFIAL